ncbi:hypothetical protein GWK47_046192 [Chionoecetes opilio]|uniref:Uncharacterized protein n=1 Tax=Chionoecetes opilio TaxID=41210 RepID=A0A8J4YCA9_CHIOP|nr:hypothetical protein GWK47_046192 [Chionoecetes opilio]
MLASPSDELPSTTPVNHCKPRATWCRSQVLREQNLETGNDSRHSPEHHRLDSTRHRFPTTLPPLDYFAPARRRGGSVSVMRRDDYVTTRPGEKEEDSRLQVLSHFSSSAQTTVCGQRAGHSFTSSFPRSRCERRITHGRGSYDNHPRSPLLLWLPRPPSGTSAGKHGGPQSTDVLAVSSFQVFRQWRRLWEKISPPCWIQKRLPDIKKLIQLPMGCVTDVQRILEHTLGMH